jgi:hypothetical protein
VIETRGRRKKEGASHTTQIKTKPTARSLEVTDQQVIPLYSWL